MVWLHEVASRPVAVAKSNAMDGRWIEDDGGGWWPKDRLSTDRRGHLFPPYLLSLPAISSLSLPALSFVSSSRSASRVTPYSSFVFSQI